jgi:hypothetical protein
VRCGKQIAALQQNASRRGLYFIFGYTLWCKATPYGIKGLSLYLLILGIWVFGYTYLLGQQINDLGVTKNVTKNGFCNHGREWS